MNIVLSSTQKPGQWSYLLNVLSRVVCSRRSENINLMKVVRNSPLEKAQGSRWEHYQNSHQSSPTCISLESEDIPFCLGPHSLVVFYHRCRNMPGIFQKTAGRRGYWISTRTGQTLQARYRYLELLRIMRWWQPECVKMTWMYVKGQKIICMPTDLN